MANKAITSRDVDFAKWYTDVVMAANLADYSNVKGCIVFEPNGYALWENIQKELDRKFKELGHVNVYMPFLIPEKLLQKEAELIEGFAPEGAWVTEGGGSKLEERMMVRPTSETLFSDYYAKKVKSYRDLPKLYNQWCNVMRWEKETRPFLRTREFLWQEGHTIHESSEEAIKETEQMLEVYRDFQENVLAIPVVTGRKTEKEKFAGAEFTLTVEALMYNGVSLQSATSHYFGQKFAKAYDIKFLNRNNELEHVYQTSWGTTTRLIGAIIMVHGDDNGLVLPPRIAPTQVMVIPIGTDEEVINISKDINSKLLNNDIRSNIDLTQKSPGFKFAEAEVNGIPVRVEIGPRDLKENKVTLVRRDTLEKKQVGLDNVYDSVKALLEDIQSNMYNVAKKRMLEKTYECDTLEEIEKIMNTNPGFVKASWCGELDCELKLKEIKGTKSRCILEDYKDHDHQCIVCGKEAKHLVMWGIQY